MMVISDITQEMIRYGKENVFLAMVISPNDFGAYFVELLDDGHKIAMQQEVIKLAATMNADCIINAIEAWGFQSTPNDPYSNLPPSLHPRREENLVVIGKNHFENLVGIQRILRSENEISFEELEIFSDMASWLDNWQPYLPTAASC